MSKGKDLTRWNRAGLSRFRYVDGTAVEYLEILRQQLAKRFVDSGTQGEKSWLQPADIIPETEFPQENETLTQRQDRLSRQRERMVEMYHQDRRDWAWEITRAFARSCHVLTEHVNSYVNEGYLGTATQWEHVRRLVAMLDYHPAPPASALTSLVFIAKGRSGVLAKGFQVKHTPPEGGPKIIFETLEDLIIDPALDTLRPKGHNRSETPAIPSGFSMEKTSSEDVLSTLASEPVKSLQGVGDIWAKKLMEKGFSQINDFLRLDPTDAPEFGIYETRLRELKARASAISLFELEPGWSDIIPWRLPDISGAQPETLAEKTGNPLNMVEDLQLRMELIGSYLDHDVYRKATLNDLLKPAGNEDKENTGEGIPSPWLAPKKPKVVAGQVAIVFHKEEEKAEAATVARVHKTSKVISLTPSPLEQSWLSWPKADVTLMVVPRWKKKCWLNGERVVRTQEPHGLTADKHICWKLDGKGWKFAKVIEADKRNLRLEVSGELPGDGDKLFEARPLDGPIMPSAIEEVGLVNEELLENPLEDITAADLFIPDGPSFPNIVSAEPDDGINILFSMGQLVTFPGPPPEFTSLILPTPLLPIDIVKAAVKLLLEIGAMVIPSTGEPVFKFIEPQKLAESLFKLVNESESVKWEETDQDTVIEDIMAAVKMPEGEEPILFKKVKEIFNEKGPFLVLPKERPVKAIVETSDPPYMFDGIPEKITPGDLVVTQFASGVKAVTVRDVNGGSTAEQYSLHFDGLVGNEGELLRVLGDFRGLLPAEGAEQNDTEQDAEKIELDQIPENLKVGRRVVMACGTNVAVSAKILDINDNVITTDAKNFSCTKKDLLIYGNAVLAGHGETKPAKIIGSGSAAKTNQEFILEVDKISFIPNTTMRGGFAAAIEVSVDGRIWEQVSSLKDSAPEDHHYATRMTEDGYVKILFGDGRNGRRLPTGKNNIRVGYRVGSGVEGNVSEHGLEKAGKPNPLIDKILHLQRAAGGGDMEDVTSLRENAPATILSLERAVSLADFSHLARSQSSIWQARAYRQVLAGGRMEGVKVVVVPAEGAFSPEIQKSTTDFLQKHSLPGVQVNVEKFTADPFNLHVMVRIDSEAFQGEEVEKAVSIALEESFSLRNRALGEHLYLSEIYSVVEKVPGVENSVCLLDDDASLQLIRARCENTVIYLALDGDSTLTIDHEEYRP